MKKFLVVFLILVFSLGVSGQSLDDFSFDPDRNYRLGFTGGESFTQEVSFDVEGGSEVPVVLRLKVDSQDYSMSGSGEEFDVSGRWRSPGSEQLDFRYTLENGTGIYRSSLGSDGLVSPGTRNSVAVTLDSNRRIVPDNYSLRLDVESVTGFERDRENVEVLEGSNRFDIGDNTVYIDSESSGNASISTYSDLAVSPPSGKAFLGGMEVNMSEVNVESGRVRIGYSQREIARNRLREESVSIYRFDRSSGEWTTEGIESVDRDFARNYVLARVDHFSTYAAFADRYYRSPPNIDYGELEPPGESEEEPGSGDEEETGQEPGEEENDGTGPEIPGIAERIPDTVPGNAAPESPVGSFLSSPTSRSAAIVVFVVGVLGLAWKLGGKDSLELKS